MGAVRDPRVKGIAFREFVRWYEQTHGHDALRRAWQSLPDPLRAQLDPERECFGLLAGSWYPIAIVTRLLESITQGLDPKARTTLLRHGIEHTLDVALSGVYRTLFDTLMTPEREARYAQKIWSSFYDTGELEGRILGPGRSEHVVKNWDGHHPLLCELTLWALSLIHERMGCKDVKVRRTSCLRDAPMCRFAISWAPES